MITVLVTGGGSQLAQCIQALAPQYSGLKFIFKTSSELDIANNAQIATVFSSSEAFDYCINCAAYTAVDKAESETEKAFEVNAEGVKHIAQACNRHQVTLIHISTDFLFDGKTSQSYSEVSLTNPLNVYGKTKLEGEQAIEQCLENYFILRTSWLYSEYGHNFLKTMLRLSKERNELSVVGDQIGSPTYAKDLAEVILRLIKSRNNSYGIYNYSNEGEVSWYDFAKEIFRLNGSSITLNKIETKDCPTPATRPKFSIMNTDKISRLLSIKIPNWKVSLEKAYSNLLKQKV